MTINILRIGFAGFGFLIASLAFKTYREATSRTLTRSRASMFYVLLAFASLLCGMALFADVFHRPASLNDPSVIRARIEPILRSKEGWIDQLRSNANLNESQRQGLLDQIANNLRNLDQDLKKAANGQQ
jgi:hypothetical protein